MCVAPTTQSVFCGITLTIIVAFFVTIPMQVELNEEETILIIRRLHKVSLNRTS